MIQAQPRNLRPGMRSGPRPFSRPPAREACAAAVIPYDYAASFKLTGRPGNLIQDVINISVEGGFVAVAMGYGFEEERGRPVSVSLNTGFSSTTVRTFVPGDILLGQIPQDALIEGFRVHPRFEAVVFAADQSVGPNGQSRGRKEKILSNQTLPAEFANQIFQRVKTREELSFLFSMVDTGTGRELQDEPIHNLASLGKSNGERPFRLLAQPLSFEPRSTIRLQIVERSQGVQGTLFIVLYGYKVIGTPEMIRTNLKSFHVPATGSALPVKSGSRIIPFDYVSKFELIGRPGNLVEDEITINVEGGFVATAIGYGLEVDEIEVPLISNALATTGAIRGTLRNERFQRIPNATINVQNVTTNTTKKLITDLGGEFRDDIIEAGEYRIEVILPANSTPIPLMETVRFEVGFETFIFISLTAPGRPPGVSFFRTIKTIPLSEIPLRQLPSSALSDGIRLRPNFIRSVFKDDRLTSELPVIFANQIFERINRPEDVSFRYSIFDTGTGRELENQPLHNVAGLGIANGDRPFKKLAQPLRLLPRSSLRISVEEHFGRGTLFLVLQGYKILDRSLSGGGL
jgi:hypothetical protein